ASLQNAAVVQPALSGPLNVARGAPAGRGVRKVAKEEVRCVRFAKGDLAVRGVPVGSLPAQRCRAVDVDRVLQQRTVYGDLTGVADNQRVRATVAPGAVGAAEARLSGVGAEPP